MPCPRCRESLRPEAIEGGGAWSCFYCEGLWVPGDSVATLRSALPPTQTVGGDELPWVRASVRSPEVELFCPTCQKSSFTWARRPDVGAYRCLSCSGIYLDKALLNSLSENRGEHKDAALPATARDFIGDAVVWVVAAVLSAGP